MCSSFSQKKIFKRNVLALCCVSLPTLAAAQTIQAPTLEEMLVTGTPIKDSQAESILRQRNATNVVNVIAADDIGRFPDQTAAAALARLPAVAVQRDQGQERYIQVRGAPARWTSVAFDGINVLGAEERIFRFDSVPAAVMNSVEISKTLTPDMPAEALAGRVDIQTYSPLSKAGFSADLDLGLGTMELGDGDQERYAARLAWGGENFGAVVAVSSFSMEQVTDNNEMDYDENNAPTLFDFRSYQLTRETNSAMAKFEFKPSEDHLYTFSSLYTEFLDHELRNMYQLHLEDALSGTRGTDSGELVGVPVQGWLQDGDYENSTFTNTLGGDHQLTHWKIDWRLNYTKTESSTELPIILSSQTDPLQFHSLSYDMSDRNLPRVQLYSTTGDATSGYTRGTATDMLNQTGFGFDGLVNYLINSETESYTAKMDVSRDWQVGNTDMNMKFGVQYDDREANSPGSSSAFVAVGPMAQAIGAEWTPAEFVTDNAWDTNFSRGFTANYVDNGGLRRQLDNAMDDLIAAGLVDPADFFPPETRYTITEEVTSAYAMNTWTWDKQQLLLGVRLEHVALVSDGFINQGVDETSGDAMIVPASVDSSETEFFPSIHWNMDLRDDVKLRLAAVTGTSRPNFTQMRAGANVSDAGQTVSGGNPDVKAEMAQGFDASLEWYFTEAALASISTFYRAVDDVLFDSVTTVEDDRFDSPDFDRTGYDYATTLNGSDGKLSGVELAYLHQWDFLPTALQGFGMQTNVAFLDGEFTTPDGRTTAFPGTSDQVINASLFYENFGWSVRLNWQWRDAWLDDISPDSSGDYYWQDTERLDLSVRYQLTEAIGFYIDANNLTDEMGVRYQGTTERPVEVEGFGSRYLVGVRASF